MLSFEHKNYPHGLVVVVTAIAGTSFCLVFNLVLLCVYVFFFLPGSVPYVFSVVVMIVCYLLVVFMSFCLFVCASHHQTKSQTCVSAVLFAELGT